MCKKESSQFSVNFIFWEKAIVSLLTLMSLTFEQEKAIERKWCFALYDPYSCQCASLRYNSTKIIRIDLF